ncbi:pig-p protein [Fusarium flagelliforme]|uniref:Pig-p protein n=1 Tax=Fusarium flagelliforme TaxID=2675880 RepID=A0A395MEI6_9HYPO|nr:pig-p protein [Fusarium flagelliforme]
MYWSLSLILCIIVALWSFPWKESTVSPPATVTVDLGGPDPSGLDPNGPDPPRDVIPTRLLPHDVARFLVTHDPNTNMTESKTVAEVLLDPLGLEITSFKELQTLWAGYGHICALTARPTDSKAAASIRHLAHAKGSNNTFFLILKLIAPPPGPTDEGHLRKILSYDVEQYFYEFVAPHLEDDTAVAHCMTSSWKAKRDGGELRDVTATIMTDLRVKFPVEGGKRAYLGPRAVQSALEWLARFHSSSWKSIPANLDEYLLPPLEEFKRRETGTGGTKLWLNGGYTYLATRRKEYESLCVDTYSEWSGALCTPFQGSEKSTAEVVADFLTPTGRPFETLIHGDVKSENLFTNDSGDDVSFVDFQYVGLGLGVCDLAKLFTCSVPLDMLTDNPSLPQEMAMDKGEQALLFLYHETLLTRRPAEKEPLDYSWETLVRHWETALVDWCRFQASWGFWGNTEWLEARVRHILKDEGWKAWLAKETAGSGRSSSV